MSQNGFVLFELYLDESGDDGGFPLFCFGGWVIESTHVREFERKWRKELKQAGVPFFHMVDCAHGAEYYKCISKTERIRHQKRLIYLINEYVQVGLVGMTPLNRNAASKNVHLVDCMSSCFASLGWTLDKINKRFNIDKKSEVFYELGHKHSNNAIQFFNEHEYDSIKSVTGMKKSESGMLQAADLLVWQYAKYIKDLHSGRPPRKDFLALTKKPIAFTHSWNESGSNMIFNQYNDSDLVNGKCRQFLSELYFNTEEVDGIVKRAGAWRATVSSENKLISFSGEPPEEPGLISLAIRQVQVPKRSK